MQWPAIRNPIVVVASHNKSHQNPIKSKHLIQISCNPFKCLFSLFLFHGHTTLFLTTMKRPSTPFNAFQQASAAAECRSCSSWTSRQKKGMILLPHLFLRRFIAGKIHKRIEGFFIGHRLWSCELGKSTVLIVQLAMVHRLRTVTRAGFNQQILEYYNGYIYIYDDMCGCFQVIFLNLCKLHMIFL